MDAQEKVSGETPSPTPKVVLSNNTPSLRRKRKVIKDVSPNIEDNLDEITEMTPFDLENLTLQKYLLLQEILKKRKRQEELQRQLKKKQVLQDVNHIFVDAFDIHNFDEGTPIIDQLVNIIDQENSKKLESNEKLIYWSIRRFETRVVDKVSITIAEEKVLLQERVQIMIELIQRVPNFYTILSNVPTFIDNIQE